MYDSNWKSRKLGIKLPFLWDRQADRLLAVNAITLCRKMVIQLRTLVWDGLIKTGDWSSGRGWSFSGEHGRRSSVLQRMSSGVGGWRDKAQSPARGLPLAPPVR